MCLAGAIWLAEGVRVAIMRRIQNMMGQLRYRLMGGLLAAVGLFMGMLQLLILAPFEIEIAGHQAHGRRSSPDACVATKRHVGGFRQRLLNC